MPTEHEIVANASPDQAPVTIGSLFRDLTLLGLTSGSAGLAAYSQIADARLRWGEGRFMRCRDVVDFAVTWMANR